VSVIKLYGPRNTPFTDKARRALIVKGLDFEHFEPESAEDYKRWSPKTGLLPVLEIDGEHIPDSTEILYRLEELYPEPALLSADPRIAGQQRQLEDWADSNLSWSFNKWRAARDTEPTSQVQRSGFRLLLGWFKTGGTWEQPEISIVRSLGDRMDDLIGFLGNRPFFYSDTLSMADLSVYSMLITMRRDFIPGSVKLLEQRPALVRLMHRIEAVTGP
jgi:glutathione S-transferase